MGRRTGTLTLLTIGLTLAALPAWACGFLIAENGAVRLARTTTLAAYVDGVEHYVTSFAYQGGVDSFGSIIPLPDVPTKVEKAGSWTLQRLGREVRPPSPAEADGGGALTARGGAEVLMEVQVEALDITVLRGGAQDVLDWAGANGFDLPAGDALPMLQFYAARSPIFLAARYDLDRAQDLDRRAGDGTPIHVEIPTDDPWVPLAILGYAKPGEEIVEADVFLLTERRPAIAPGPYAGLHLDHSDWASSALLDDLRSDENSSWVPQEAWLSYVRVEERAGELNYDLAIAADGGKPSWVDAGLEPTGSFIPVARRADYEPDRTAWIVLAALALVGLGLFGSRRSSPVADRPRSGPAAPAPTDQPADGRSQVLTRG